MKEFTKNALYGLKSYRHPEELVRLHKAHESLLKSEGSSHDDFRKIAKRAGWIEENYGRKALYGAALLGASLAAILVDEQFSGKIAAAAQSVSELAGENNLGYIANGLATMSDCAYGFFEDLVAFYSLSYASLNSMVAGDAKSVKSELEGIMEKLSAGSK